MRRSEVKTRQRPAIWLSREAETAPVSAACKIDPARHRVDLAVQELVADGVHLLDRQVVLERVVVKPHRDAHDVSIGLDLWGLLGGVGGLALREPLGFAQHGGGVEAAAEAEDRQVGRQVAEGAGAVVVDAEEADGVGLAQLLELRGQVLGRPEADDLDEHAAAAGGGGAAAGSRGR